jgi:hypothetical protein
MSRFLPFAIALLMSPPILEDTSSAFPRISTYVTSGTLSTNAPACIDQMRSAAVKAGFSASQEVVMDKNGKAGDFHSESTNFSLHFTARCNSTSKTWGMALSGTDPNKTFSEFQAIATSILQKREPEK